MKSSGSNLCTFCTKLHQPNQRQTDNEFLYEDQDYFSFYDIDKSSAREHILVCTKQHIPSATDIINKETILRMRQIGVETLDRICEEKNLQHTYRFGFHLRPYNTINHIHLHCFVLPFSSLLKDKIVYGKMLTSIEEIIEKLRAEAHPRF